MWKFRGFYKHSLETCEVYHTKFGPDRFCRFDVYWTQTDKQSITIDIYFVCLSVKTAEPIGPKFCVGPHMTPGNMGRVMDDRIFKNLHFLCYLIFIYFASLFSIYQSNKMLESPGGGGGWKTPPSPLLLYFFSTSVVFLILFDFT